MSAIGSSALIVLVAVVLAAVLLVVIALGRALAANQASRVLPIILFGAIAVAVIAGSYAVFTAAITLFSDAVTVTFPVSPFPVEVPRGVTLDDTPVATLVSGSMDAMTAQVRGLGALARILLASGTLLYGAMTVVIALSVSRLAASLRRRAAFRPGAGRAFVASALAVFVGGGAGSITTQLGELQASSDVLQVWSWSYTGPEAPDSLVDLGWPDPAEFLLTVEWWPLLIAFALAAVGIAFRAGEQLRTRAEAAERDTEGLV
ncbi:hypothetical protein [Protaetiibacter larvae]|uniref:Uncharacterized protein n=1 Tax=Protaetiibacter larvae TaxID=2592654 RepID=A0A5C1Y6X2_9MICO|nr:hypothetical protein [Protaetiibacter larvae]QEO09188.1 hypothetical protein FLP23_03665 [Protaetiibacter larvae]